MKYATDIKKKYTKFHEALQVVLKYVVDNPANPTPWKIVIF